MLRTEKNDTSETHKKEASRGNEQFGNLIRYYAKCQTMIVTRQPGGEVEKIGLGHPQPK